MRTPTDIHTWFIEQTMPYLTDGLEDDERVCFEAHAAECDACAAGLAAAREEDAEFRNLFGKIEPSAGFENRVIQHLRDIPSRWIPMVVPRRLSIHPMVIRAAGAAAAAAFLAGVGYVGLGFIEHGQPQFAENAASQIRQIGSAKAPWAQPNVEYSYANTYPNSDKRNYRQVIGPTFYVSHGKDGQNVAAGDLPELTSSADRSDAEAGKIIANHQIAVDQMQKELSQYKSDKQHALQEISRLNQEYERKFGEQQQQLDSDRADYKKFPEMKLGRDGLATQVAQAQSQDSLKFDAQNGPALRSSLREEKLSFKNVQPTGASLAPPQNQYFRPVDQDGKASVDNKTAGYELAERLPGQNSSDFALADQPAKPPAQAPAGTGAPQTPPASEVPTTPATPQASDTSRKVIRHGELAFEVDSFDSAFAQISKIAAEESGFVDSTSSEKLDNGKVSGIVTVRVPPDHLDTLILKLRGIGDLKGQKIAADDVTKEYTDLESELRAAKAMEDRLLDIIKTGKGEVKDLVAAEKELGTWREKVEKVTGEINYYNNLISLSTLQVNLTERDIRQAALATETEHVNMGIETQDVEKARADALHAIDDAKGRIIQSDLKQFDAGQLAATIVAQVSPDAAGPVIDRLKQLGRVARLDMGRQQTTANGAPVAPGIKVQRQDTELHISLYNLANIAPRQTTNLALACDDVESAYHDILSRISDAGGRVVDSSLNRVNPQQIDGTINFETPSEKADAVLAAVRSLGEVMHLTVAENPDAANVTTAKRGFALTLASLATVAPRETISTSLIPAGSMSDAYHAILAAAQAAGAHISTSQLTEQNTQSGSATLVFEVARAHQTDLDKAISQTTENGGRVLSHQSARSVDTEHTVDSKVQYALTFASADALGPRESINRVLAVADVTSAYNAILSAAQHADAKINIAKLAQIDPQNMNGELDLIVPRSGVDAIEKAIADSKAGVVSRSVDRSSDLNGTTDQKTELHLVVSDVDQVPPRQITTISITLDDPEKASADLQAAALAGGGRIVDQNLSRDDQFVAHLVIDVPLNSGSQFIDRVRAMGSLKSIQQGKNPAVPEADFTHARLDLTLAGQRDIVGQDTGIFSSIKTGLGASIRGLLYSLELIIIGVCLIVPWLGALWLGWKAMRRLRRKSTADAPITA